MCSLINIHTLDTIYQANNMQQCVNYLYYNRLSRDDHMISDNKGIIKEIKYYHWQAAIINYHKKECKKCGKKENLTFHHKNPKEKKFNISNHRYNWNESLLIKEIKKCIVVCRDCHDLIERGE